MNEKQGGMKWRKSTPETPPAGPAAEPWLVLVVDDDLGMLQVTQMVLDDMRFEDRPLELLQARSFQEATTILDSGRQPALALVDVVMETDDAGLRLVRYIREELANPYTRIVLRTGQPGQAPEEAVIRDYDINDYREKTELSSRKLLAVVQTALRGYRDIEELRLLRDRFDALAHLDGLTGIANRRSFDETLAQEWSRCQRAEAPLALILADVDLFKRYNDRFGHKAGDTVLRQVARVLDGAMRRPGDLAARYGGEEFACILPDIDEAGAIHVAEMIREKVYQLNITNPDSNVAPRVTVSFGVALMRPSRELKPPQLVELADARLYAAKRAGRNRVADSTGTASPQRPRESGVVAPSSALILAREARGIAAGLVPAHPALNACLERLVARLREEETTL